MKAIIPTGGRGTRMRPLTFSANKHFIPVANKPLIFYPIETVANLGIKQIAITYNPSGLEEAKSILGDGSNWGLEFTYCLQEKPAGLANIVQVCEEFIAGDSFIFHLGDNIFVDGLEQQFEYFEKNKPNGLVTMVHHPENNRMGVPYFDDEGRLLKYVEKPENPPHDFAIPGVYFADSNFFRVFKEDPIQPSARGEYEIPDAFQWMIDHNLRVDVMEYKGKWLDPGKFNDWIEANQYILDTTLESEIDESTDIDGETILENRIKIGKNCVIKKSHLRGPLIIGNNVEINGSYIGPFSSLADDCKIEEGHIENSVFMNGVFVKKVSNPIDSSLIGTETEIVKKSSPTTSFSFFVGEKCKVEV